MKAKVGIVLLNYNSYEDTIDCINSLSNINYDNYCIVIIDNCSTDDSFAKLKKINSNKIYIIKSEFNGGWSSGNNLGIKKCLELNCEYILLLNNDTLVEKNFLEILIDFYEKNKICGIVSPKIMYNSNRKMIWFAGGSINFHKFLADNIGNKEFDGDEFSNIHESEYITGCAMLINKKIINDCGYLPEEYFMYLEDVDYSLQVKKHGYKLYVQPKSIIYHKVSASTGGEDSPFTIKWMTRNRWLFFKKYKNLSIRSTTLSAIHIFLSNFKNILNYVINFDIKRLNAMLSGMLEGMRLLFKS